MDVKLLVIFVVLNIFNVIIQTVKSIVTVKCGKVVASVVNAVAYGLYTIVTVYMLCELPLLWKAGIVAGCNLIGVFVVKWIEEKSRKDKLWKVEATVPTKYASEVHSNLKIIPHNYIEHVGNYTIFNFYCSTQKQSAAVKEIINQYDAKYFVSENKAL